jgi:FkbM family methyltransferase
MIPTRESKSAKELLDEILSEDPEATLTREKTAFDEIVGPFSRSLILFGAGGLGRKTLAGLRKIGIEPFGFTDNNSALWGKLVDGVQVYSPDEAARLWNDKAAFVVTTWRHDSKERMGDRISQFKKLGCQSVVSFVPLFWKYPDIFLPHFLIELPSRLLKHRNEISEVFSTLADEASCREFVAQIRLRSFGDFEGLPSPVDHEQYFPDDLWAINTNTVFLDCGTYTGDTIQSFLKRSGSNYLGIIAIEPDPQNYLQLTHYLDELPLDQRKKITSYQLAVGSQKGQVQFDAQGTVSSSVGSGSMIVNCVPIDDLVSNENLPTIVKIDIEGAEPDALIGAQKTISQDKPFLAVCVYHRQNHLWQLPKLICTISEEYLFYLRPHQLDGWDLVCYGVPK